MEDFDGLLNIREEVEEIEQIEEILNINNELYPVGKIYKEHQNPLIIYNDTEFKIHCRMSKATAQYVIDLLREHLQPLQGNRGRPVSAEVQVLATIRYLAKGAYQADIADIHGLHQTTLSRIVNRVVQSLAGYRERFIKFPTTQQNIHETKENFYAIAGCPNIIGAIDCTHMKINCPGGNYPLLYLNRKGYYSLNVQVVGDSKCKITNIVARWRGSAHDSRIWDTCMLKDRFINGDIDGILLGDNGYPCTHYVLTPLLNPVTEAERRYNRAHIRTRNTVERLFGCLKNKFRSLFNGLQIDLQTAKAAIIAIAILHNICIDANDGYYNDIIENEDGEDGNIQNHEDLVRGVVFRQQYIQTFFRQ